MTGSENTPWPSLRLAFMYDGELDEPGFEERLRVGDLSLRSRYHRSDLEVLECESREPGFVGSIRLTRSDEVADIGCAYLAGPDHIDLAMKLVTALQFVPAAVLHLQARLSTEKQIRVGALHVLAQLYLAEDGRSYWDPHIEHTTRIVRGDADGSLRLYAIFIEVLGKSPGVRRHIRELLAANPAPQDRQRLEEFLEKAEQHAESSEAGDHAESAPEPELRLALPFMQRPPIDELLKRFDAFGERVEDIQEGDMRLMELDFHELDGRMTVVSLEGSRVGCIYFSGPDAPDIAAGIGPLLAYLPPELARMAARSSRDGEYRQRALQALALSASTRFLPGKGVDPELRVLLQQALVDPDPGVKATAMNMSYFLRDELSRE